MLIHQLLSYHLTVVSNPETNAHRHKALGRHLGDRESDSIRGVDLTVYRRQRREEGVCDSTINRELAVLRAAFNVAWKHELISKRPRSYPMIQEPPPIQEWMTATELDEVCSHLAPDLVDVARFMYSSGWRVRSVCRLRWGDVHLGRESIELPAVLSKNRVSTEIPLVGDMLEMLRRRWADHGPSPYVFTRRGKAIQSLRKAWGNACTAAGRPRFRLHSLRRSMAQLHLSLGIPKEATMRIGNWLTDSMYRRYAIASRETLEKALTRADEAARQDPEPEPERNLHPRVQAILDQAAAERRDEDAELQARLDNGEILVEASEPCGFWCAAAGLSLEALRTILTAALR